MRKINWREWGATLWNQRILTLPRIVFILALLLLVARLGIALFEYARLARAALAFPFPLDYGEGPMLDQTLRLLQFENIYRNSFASPPYTVSNYPPVFQLIQAPLARIFGPAFWYGRLISIVSAVSAATLIGLILNTLTSDRIAAALGGLTLLAFPYLLQGSVLNRVDTLAFALSLGGLYVAVRWPDHRQGLLVACLLFIATAFTNARYALVALLTAFVWLLHLEHRKQALRLAAIVTGTCLGLFLSLNLITQGGFYLNTVAANLTSFSWDTVTGYVINLYLHAGYLVIGSLIFIGIERLGEATRSWPLVVPYCLGSALMILTAGAANSGANDLFEVVAALCLASGAFIAWAGENYWLKALLVFVLAVQMNVFIDWSRQDYVPAIMNKVADTREVEQLAEYVQEARGPILADEYMGLLPLYGRRIYFQPIEYKQLQAVNLWSEAPLIASIQREEFSIILLYLPRRWSTAITSRWSPALRDNIYAHYRWERTLAETLIYLPEKDPR
ncbi:MAG TPA: glycosyltransferase family 39 protein [Anaerolineales bacterium]|nr:glycosyltransferase family 39 protein [Anaerolineales bacterium]